MVRQRPRSRNPPSDTDWALALSTGPFHVALRNAIRWRDLPLDRLRRRLAEQGINVALSSLSGWQNGTHTPTGPASLRAVAALELILDLPSQTLSRLLQGSPPLPQRALRERDGPLGELLNGLPGSRERSVDILSHELRFVIGSQRQLVSTRSRLVVRARRDGVHSYLVRTFGENNEPGHATAAPRALRNCTIGRTYRHPTAPVMVVEIDFGVSLMSGATWVFEWETLDTGLDPSTDAAFGFRHHVDLLVLEVPFDAVAQPSMCRAYTRSDLDAELIPGGQLPVNAFGSTHLCLIGRGAGVVGICWQWLVDCPLSQLPKRRPAVIGLRARCAGHGPDRR